MVFFFEQKTAYEMRISDWSSDVCSSDLRTRSGAQGSHVDHRPTGQPDDAVPRRCRSHLGSRRYPQTSPQLAHWLGIWSNALPTDRKSVVKGKSVSVRVDLGGRRSIKKTT